MNDVIETETAETLTPWELRKRIRSGDHQTTTAGWALGHLQGNLVILPADWALDFAIFCVKTPPVVKNTDLFHHFLLKNARNPRKNSTTFTRIPKTPPTMWSFRPVQKSPPPPTPPGGKTLRCTSPDGRIWIAPS